MDEGEILVAGTAALDVQDAGLSVEQWELLRNCEWNALVRSILETLAIEDRYRTVLMPAVRAMARRMAEVEINHQRRELLRERTDMLEAYSGFVKVAKEMVNSLDLGIYDEVVSVAVKRADGRIDVVKIG